MTARFFKSRADFLSCDVIRLEREFEQFLVSGAAHAHRSVSRSIRIMFAYCLLILWHVSQEAGQPRGGWAYMGNGLGLRIFSQVDNESKVGVTR